MPVFSRPDTAVSQYLAPLFFLAATGRRKTPLDIVVLLLYNARIRRAEKGKRMSFASMAVAIACTAAMFLLPDGIGRAGTAANGSTNNKKGSGRMETATFGAGCFWGVEAEFRKVEGVISTAVGYSGGIVTNPTYKQVCTDTTGHAEVVEVVYDPGKVSYDELLDIFWDSHDPTQVNRQGPDIGRQYRSVIFYHSPLQQQQALASKERLERAGVYRRPISTEIEPAQTFYRAEEYHQQYLEKRGMPSCATGSH